MDQLRNLILGYFSWFRPESRHSTRAHMLRGFTKSFMLYFVPITLLRRGSFYHNLRRALALGVFVAGVRAGDDILTKLKDESFKGKPKTTVEEFVTKYTLGVSAFLSALVAINIDGEINRSITVVLWTLVRSLRPFVPDIPGGSTFLMCLTAAQLLSTWISSPEDHNPTYRKFLDYHGAINRKQSAELVKNPVSACGILHPGETCTEYIFRFFLQSIPRSARLYIPVFLTSFVLSASKNIPRTIIGYSRSVLFLSLYCTFAWATMCASNLVKPRITRTITFMHAWVAGLAVLIETKYRRAELAAYCLTYALETIFIYFKRRGYIDLSPTLNTLLLALSAGVLVHHHDHQPRAAMHWLFKLGSGTVRDFP